MPGYMSENTSLKSDQESGTNSIWTTDDIGYVPYDKDVDKVRSKDKLSWDFRLEGIVALILPWTIVVGFAFLGILAIMGLVRVY